jgi:hypothetical protein
MLKGSKAEIESAAKTLVLHRIYWLLFLCVPIAVPVFLAGCYGLLFSFFTDGFFARWFLRIGGIVGLLTPLWVVLGLNWIHRIPARSMIEKLMQMEKNALSQCIAALTESPEST